MTYENYSSISFRTDLQQSLAERRLDPKFWSPQAQALNRAFDQSQKRIAMIGTLVTKRVYRGVQPNYDDKVGTIPVLKTTDVQNRKVDWSACRRVTEDFFASYPRGQLYRDNIVVTSTGEGSWGRAAIVDVDRALADGHLTILRL